MPFCSRCRRAVPVGVGMCPHCRATLSGVRVDPGFKPAPDPKPYRQRTRYWLRDHLWAPLLLATVALGVAGTRDLIGAGGRLRGIAELAGAAVCLVLSLGFVGRGFERRKNVAEGRESLARFNAYLDQMRKR